MSANGNYKLQHSHEMMQNHIEGAMLDVENGFSALKTPLATVLLTIGSDGVFRASAAAGNQVTGWTTIELSKLNGFPTGDAPVVKYFAQQYDASKNTLTLLAIANGGGTTDQLIKVSGPEDADPAVWLFDPTQCNVETLAFPANPVKFDGGYVAAADLECLDLIAVPHQVSGESDLIVVMVRNQDLQSNQVAFIIDESSDSIWNYFKQERPLDTDDKTEIVIGKAEEDQPMGIYKLYESGGTPVLSYQPGPGQDGPNAAVLYSVPDGASTIASRIFLDSSGWGSKTSSELYVAASSGIYSFSHDIPNGSTGTLVLADSRFAGAEQLHLVEATDSLTIWAVTQSGLVLYSSAPIVNGSVGQWTIPIVLANQSKAVCGIAGTPAAELDMFVYGTIEASVTTETVTESLLRLKRDSVTTLWNKTHVSVPHAGNAITLKTYGTRLLVLDENNVPANNISLKVTPTLDVPILLNGESVNIKAGESFDLLTDSSGTADLVQTVSTLVGTRYTIESNDPNVVLDGGGETINPAADTQAKIASIQPNTDLTKIQYEDANGKTQNLVKTNYTEDAASAANAISGLHGSISQNKLPYASSQTPGERESVRALAHRLKEAGLLDTDLYHSEWGFSLFHDIGDFIEGVVHAVEDVAEIVFNAVKDAAGYVIHVAVTIGEAVIHTIARTVEDIYGVITAVFKKIGAIFEDIFEWLAFLFQWHTFKSVGDILNGYITTFLSTLPGVAGAVQTNLDSLVSRLEAGINDPSNISKLSKAIPGQSGSQGLGSRQPQNFTVHNSTTGKSADLRSDPKLGWMKARSHAAATQGGRKVTSSAGLTLREDASIPFSTALNLGDEVAASIETLIASLVDDVVEFANGTLTLNEVFTSVLAQVEKAALTDLKDIGDALCQVAIGIGSNDQSKFDFAIEIPVISPLYHLATGKDLKLLDLVCLLMGIIFSIFYKIATDRDPLADLEAAALDDKIKSYVSSLPDLLHPDAAHVQEHLMALQREFAGKNKALEDGNNDVASYLIGFSEICHGILMIVMGEIGLATAKSKTASSEGITYIHMADLVCRIIGQVGKAIDKPFQPGAPVPYYAAGSILLNGLMFFMDISCLLSDSSSDKDLGADTRKLDTYSGILMSGYAAFNLCLDCKQATTSQAISSMIGLSSLFQVLLIDMIKKSDNPDAVKDEIIADEIVILLRGAGTIVLGSIEVLENYHAEKSFDHTCD